MASSHPASLIIIPSKRARDGTGHLLPVFPAWLRPTRIPGCSGRCTGRSQSPLAPPLQSAANWRARTSEDRPGTAETGRRLSGRGWRRTPWAGPHLHRDVGVVSREDQVLALLPPLHQRHGEGEDLAQEHGDAAGTVDLADGRNLDGGSSAHNNIVSRAPPPLPPPPSPPPLLLLLLPVLQGPRPLVRSSGLVKATSRN